MKQHARSFAYSIYFLVVPLGLQFSSPTTADEAGVSFCPTTSTVVDDLICSPGT
jgi:hypothetical protein